MLVIPAIDLMNGEAVRLEKGDFAKKTVYDRKPADKAAQFAAAGARLLHVVDLAGAKAGWPVNVDAIAEICRVPGIEVELVLLDLEATFEGDEGLPAEATLVRLASLVSALYLASPELMKLRA